MSDNEKTLEVYQPKSLALVPPSNAENTAVILAAREKAMVEGRYVVAIKKPRDVDAVREALLKECRRPYFAVVARYHKPIGKGIEGPSIRFAEAAIQAMSNVLVETPTIDENAERRIMRVTVLDIESNTSYSQDIVVHKAVERSSFKPGDTVISSRQNSKGQTVYLITATDDDVLNKQNALVSKAIRTLGLRLVPGWLIEECMDTVKKTLDDAEAKDPDQARRQRFDAFAAIGVGAEELKGWLRHDGNTLSREERSTLVAILNAIKEGETTWAAVMEARNAERQPPKEGETMTAEQKRASDLKTLLEQQKEKAKAAQKPPATSGGAAAGAASGTTKPA